MARRLRRGWASGVASNSCSALPSGALHSEHRVSDAALYSLSAQRSHLK
jgi:hypothetical protein